MKQNFLTPKPDGFCRASELPNREEPAWEEKALFKRTSGERIEEEKEDQRVKGQGRAPPGVV